ncbi:hypothetical protein [Pacificispira sp.]|uniref:hypothetical protein n=1 Tax=Pacificispira sp. TaxID=2888761 RepID=UPI003B528AC3
MSKKIGLGVLMATLSLGLSVPVLADDLTVEFADPAWTGDRIPDGQHCKKFGGSGATPPLKISGIPAEANAIVVEFNDRSFQKLSYDGGHGKIGFMIEPGKGEAMLPAVPGGTDAMPDGVWLEKKNRATGAWYSDGYLPPCSGGKGNTYEAEVFAVIKDGDDYDEIAEGEIRLGRY